MIQSLHRHSCLLLLLLLMMSLGCKRTESDSGAKDRGSGAPAPAPANSNLPYEPRDYHALVELSNLRIKPPMNNKEVYEVDWRITKEGQDSNFVLVIRLSGGGESTRTIHTMRGK